MFSGFSEGTASAAGPASSLTSGSGVDLDVPESFKPKNPYKLLPHLRKRLIMPRAFAIYSPLRFAFSIPSTEALDVLERCEVRSSI